MSAIRIRKLVVVLTAAVLVGLASTASAGDSLGDYLPAPPPPLRKTAPRDAYAKERQMFQADEIRKAFPRLGNKFDIVGKGKGNAFGDVLGLDRWVNPETGDADNPFAGMDHLFGEYGYERQSNFELALESGVEKIVLYATVSPDGTVKDITAAARQEPDGSWTAKIGKLSKIRISDPYLLRGPQYGLPMAVYAR
jgi:hypothetical protein